jgi:hypothetical protein
MDNQQLFGLDDLVRDPKFNLINNIQITNTDDDNRHDYLDPQLSDSPYTHATFNLNYYDSTELAKRFSKDSCISLLSINVQSLPAKFEALKEFVTELIQTKCQPDIICLQETWTVLDEKFFPLQGYQPLIFKNRYLGRGGGIYVKVGLIFKILPDKSTFIDKLYASLFIEIISPKGKKITLGNIYRPNSKYSDLTQQEQFSQFNEILLTVLSTSHPGRETIIVGDFNLDLLKPTHRLMPAWTPYLYSVSYRH